MITLPNGDGIVWPCGKRIAVMLTFDFDAEYLRYSVIGREATGFADISRGQYGPHEGLARCLALLERQNIRTTFFVPGKGAEAYPDAVKEIARRHELAYHGYEHDAALGISAAAEEENMAKSEALLSKLVNQKIAGHRAPLDTLQPCSIELMQKRGYLYSSTLKDCDWAYIHEGAAPLVELPTEPGFDDFSWFYFSYAEGATITCCYPANYVYDFWKDAFDELAAEGDKIMVLKLHPQLIGRSSRIRMLECLILYMKQNGAWLAPCADVANYVINFAKLRRLNPAAGKFSEAGRAAARDIARQLTQQLQASSGLPGGSERGRQHDLA